MAYASVRGRKPMERASKIAHAEVISNPAVKAFLARCSIPHAAESATIDSLLAPIPEPDRRRIRAVIAIDGGFTEVPVRDEFPSATITFFTFGPLLLQLSHLAELDIQPFIAPEDMIRLKRIQRFSLVLPTRNISLHGRTLHRSVRDSLHAFFVDQPKDEPPFADALRWLLFRGWNSGVRVTWPITRCPNPGCPRQGIVLTIDSPGEQSCSTCGGPIYLADALRLHEAVDEDHGASGILSYVITVLEQIVLVHLIKTLWEMAPRTLQEILFIKDGPLAFFGQTAPLSTPMRELAAFLQSHASGLAFGTAGTSLLNAVGLEKSGPFVDHAMQIADRIEPGAAVILTNDYIYRFIVPGDPTSPDPYGKNTYWGGKLIFKAWDSNVYVATVPTGGFNPSPTVEDFQNLAEILEVVGNLRCSMYDNALVPIALANKLVSLSDFPSARILESFARGSVGRFGSP